MRKILLVEPDFPIPHKSKNHKNFLPIGLLKIATYLRNKGYKVRLVRGTIKQAEELYSFKSYKPHEVWITSLFTYWAQYVKEAVIYYKEIYPDSIIIVGGVYASLFPRDEVKKFTGCDKVYQGVMREAEDCLPAYDLLQNTNPHPIDYQIIHTSRGCVRRCKFCGTWKIEPTFVTKGSVKNEIKYKKLVFYDNNLLANPEVENILNELIELKKNKRILWCESQSGFDGRILIDKPYLASMLKKAGFRYPRIAWDGKYKERYDIKKQLKILIEAGYNAKDIYVFVLYNWEISFSEMEMKRIKCWEWGVQIADCRFRPLNQLYDKYNPFKVNQTLKDYYIHTKSGWTDALIKQFRKNIRRQNICIRQRVPFYSRELERKKIDKVVVKKVKTIEGRVNKINFIKKVIKDYWFPDSKSNKRAKGSALDI